VRRCVASLC